MRSGLVVGLIIGIVFIAILNAWLVRLLLREYFGFKKRKELQKNGIPPSPMLQLPVPVTHRAKERKILSLGTPGHRSMLSANISPNEPSPTVDRARTQSYSKSITSTLRLAASGLKDSLSPPPMPSPLQIEKPSPVRTATRTSVNDSQRAVPKLNVIRPSASLRRPPSAAAQGAKTWCCEEARRSWEVKNSALPMQQWCCEEARLSLAMKKGLKSPPKEWCCEEARLSWQQEMGIETPPEEGSCCDQARVSWFEKDRMALPRSAPRSGSSSLL